MNYSLGNMLSRSGAINPDGLALDLQFAADKTLTARRGPTPTFSRASAATEIGSDGLIRYAPENLLLQSETFGTTWTASQLNTTGTPSYLNVAESPIGTVTADKIIANTTTGTHQFRQDATLVAGVVYVLSCYFKAAEQQFASIQAFGVANGNNDWLSLFDVSSSPSTGTIIGFTNSSVTSVGNGWNRCVVVFTATASGSLSIRIGGAGTKASGGQFYTGDNSSGILVWGAQLERHTSARTYIPTTTAAVYGARFDHDPVTLASRGLLVEEARTNLMPGSNNFTGYWVTGGGSLSSAANVAPDGAANSFLFSEDTATSAHRFFQSFTGVSGTTYTTSVFLKFAGRTQVFIETRSITSNPFAVFDIQSGTVVQVSSGITATMQQFPNGWWRCSITGTANAAGGNTLIGGFVSGSQSYTGSGSAAFYAFGAQVEAGSFPTSYIPTTTASVVRSADVCSITGSDFSGFYNQSEGTLAGELNVFAPSPSVAPEFFRFGSGNDRIQLGSTNVAGSAIRPFIISGGTTTYNSTQGTATVGVSRKVALAFATNDAISCFNGALGTQDTSVVIPTPLNAATIGGSLTGHIAFIRYYRKRLPDTKLQSLTA